MRGSFCQGRRGLNNRQAGRDATLHCVGYSGPRVSGDQRKEGGMSMAKPDALRHTRIPLSDGPGAMPAVGFGTLIPDPARDQKGYRDRVGGWVSPLRLCGAIPQRGSGRRCDAGRVQGRDGSARGRLRHHETMEHQSSSRAGQACPRGQPAAAANRLCRLPISSTPLSPFDPATSRTQGTRAARSSMIPGDVDRDLARAGKSC